MTASLLGPIDDAAVGVRIEDGVTATNLDVTLQLARAAVDG